MYALEKLYEVIEQSLFVPSDTDVSLKLYCEYFEHYIDGCIYSVETSSGEKINVKINANRVPHIIDLHAFYDKRLKDKKLRFPGSFSNADGYRNMKNSVITFATLKNSKGGQVWEKNTVRDRVLGFPYIRNAIMRGTWYKFDIDKCEVETKVLANYIAVWKIGKIYFNFCFKIEDETSDYYCLSDIVVYKTNSRVKNQDLLDVERVTEFKNGKPNVVICHAAHIRSMLKNSKYSTKSIVCEQTHKKMYKESNKFNSVLIGEEYSVEFLKIDKISKYVR